jgi:4-hydroxy-3-polyprenylbenzoate decarboxylase
MGTVGRLAAGLSDDLITRAADVVLKEGGKLIVVPRETPLSVLHLENLAKLARLGVVVMPAMPSFYHRPQTVEELVDTVVLRVLDHLGIEVEQRRWGGGGG